MHIINILFNRASFFVLLCCLEVVLPILAPDSKINSIVFWSILFISLFYAIVQFENNIKIAYFKWLYILLAMFFLYGMAYCISGPKHISPSTGLPLFKLSYTTLILKSLMPVFPIYYYSKNGLITDLFVKIWIIPFFLIALIYYFDQMMVALQRHLMSEDVTNNAGYFIASLIPLVLFFSKRRLLQYLYLFICLVFVIYSMKRGAVLFSSIMLLVYFKYSFMGINSKKILSIVFSLIILVFGVYYFISNYMIENLFFMERIQETMEGNSSDRDILYGEFIDYYINKASLFHQIFGGGANNTLSISFNYAHNDWIEILVNQGFIGVIIFFMFWRAFFLEAIKNSKEKRYCIVLRMICFGFFVKTLFSMSYTDFNIFTNLCLGFSMSKFEYKRKIA